MSNVESTLQTYSAAANGSSSSSSDPFGKVTFPTVFGTAQEDKVFVAQVTPVIHYSLGGIKVYY